MFVKGILFAPKDAPKLPEKAKFNEKQWNAIYILSQKIPIYKDILDNIKENLKEWETWIFAEEPADVPLPFSFEE